MATQQEIQDAYNRAKAKLDANKALALKQAAEKLSLQTQQFGQNKLAQQQQATQSASSAYVQAQQGQRVLGSQLAQSGLAQTGYKSLAQKKMAESLTKNRQGIETNLQGNLQQLQQGQDANLLNNKQNVANINNDYTQNLADLNLNKTQQATQQTNFDTTLQKGYSGQYTYDQFKTLLDDYGLTATQKSAYLQAYLKYQNQRYAGEMNLGQIQTQNPVISTQISSTKQVSKGNKYIAD